MFSGLPVTVCEVSLAVLNTDLARIQNVDYTRFEAAFPNHPGSLTAWPDHQAVRAHLDAGNAQAVQFLVAAIMTLESELRRVIYSVKPVDLFGVVGTGAHDVVIWWDSQLGDLALELPQAALAGLRGLVSGDMAAYDKARARLFRRASRRRLTGSTALLRMAAERRGLPVEMISGQHLVLGEGARQQHLYSSLSGTTSFSSTKLSLDKRHSNRQLARLALPVPRQMGLASPDEAVAAVAELGGQIVIKPLRGNQGRGVTVGITDAETARSAYERADSEGSGVIAEEMVAGTDYRMIVVGGRCVGVIHSTPPEVTGNGQDDVATLIARLNALPERDDIRLSPVLIDGPLEQELAAQGLSLAAVPPEGRSVRLRSHGHVATGGVTFDVTDETHPDNLRLAKQCAEAIGLAVAGIDFVTPDITRSWRETGGKVLEVNARPGLGMHHWPSHGTPRDVSGSIIDHLYPSPDAAFLPTLLFAGDRFTDAGAQVAARLFGESGFVTGAALKKGAFIDGRPVDVQGHRNSRGAAQLRRDPVVQALVVAASLRRMVGKGAGLLRTDGVAMLLEEDQADPIASRGIELLLALNPTGPFVTPAGAWFTDELLTRLPPQRVVLVCQNPEEPAVAAHLAAGGLATSVMWGVKGAMAVLQQRGHILAETLVPTRSQRRERSIEAEIYAFALFHAAAAARPSAYSGPV